VRLTVEVLIVIHSPGVGCIATVRCEPN